MAGGMSTGITLCMIVKNEQRWIEGCLNSVKSIVDDIIIVDTGSTDATIELAKPFNPTIFNYTWRNDFSDARNVGLNAAKTPWIMMMDADERIASRDLPILVAATRKDCTGFELMWRNYGFNPAIDGWTVNTSDYEEGKEFPGYAQDPMLRIYRNHPLLKYQGVVHEYIPWKKHFPDGRVDVLPAVIHHYGRALSPKRMAEKGEMYLQLGYAKIKQYPHKWEPYFELGIQLQEFNRHAEALPHLEKAYELSNKGTKSGLLLFYIGIAKKHLGDLPGGIATLKRALETGYDTTSVRLTLGNLYSSQGDIKQAKVQYGLAQSADPKNSLLLLNQGLLLRDQGDLAGAERMFSEALEVNPAYSLPAVELAALRTRQNRRLEAVDILEKVIKRDPSCDLARRGLALLYIQSERPNEAIEILKDAKDDSIVETLRGAAYLNSGQFDLARTIFESVLKRDRTLIDARINLGNLYARMGDFTKAARHVLLAYNQTQDRSLMELAERFQQMATA